MKKIKTLILNNFKFFYGEKNEIDFDRKNILLYGENGSGKSSIYWALYTILQSAFKDSDADIRKYFEHRNDKNLINSYADTTSESGIHLVLEEDGGAQHVNEISKTVFNARTDREILEAVLGSDFIDHKVLSRTYSYYHGEDIDLFEYFSRHLFPFINFGSALTIPGQQQGNENAKYWWDYIKEGMNPRPKMHEQSYKDFQILVTRFNSEFSTYLNKIIDRVNLFLQNEFHEKFKLILTYEKATYNAFKDSSYSDYKEGVKSRSWKIKPPKLLIKIELTDALISDAYKKNVNHPQSYLNEARLSLLAMAIRFAILDEKFVRDRTKILVLDDILLSMDLCNREFILDIILKKYGTDYQILFFTHQRGLFQDAMKIIENYHSDLKRQSGEANPEILKNAWKDQWKVLDMYESENEDKVPVPVILPHKSSLQKAYSYFKENIDYNACGNNLRVSLEEYFRKFIPHKYFIDADGDRIAEVNLTLENLLRCARNYFTYLQFDISPLDKLDRYKSRSLNPSSHYNPSADYYKKEFEDIFSIIEELKKNKNDALLKTNNIIKFSITTQSGRILVYSAKLMDDICLYKKSDGRTNSYFKDADERIYNLTQFSNNGHMTPLNHETTNLTLKEFYDETCDGIQRNLHEVAIPSQNIYTTFTDEQGNTLESLKKY